MESGDKKLRESGGKTFIFPARHYSVLLSFRILDLRSLEASPQTSKCHNNVLTQLQLFLAKKQHRFLLD
mgnify:CR=1 FL=1